jgi:hypothetical protein
MTCGVTPNCEVAATGSRQKRFNFPQEAENRFRKLGKIRKKESILEADSCQRVGRLLGFAYGTRQPGGGQRRDNQEWR